MSTLPSSRRDLVQGLVSLLLVGCSRGPSGPQATGRAPSDRSASDFTFDGARPELDRGQKAPPLPPDLNVWAWDAGGFVGDPLWYGEHDWDGVRMRLLGHLAWLGRDRARLASRAGNLEGARAEIVMTTRDLSQAAPRRRGGVATSLHRALSHAMQRDIALFDGLKGMSVPDLDDATSVLSTAVNGQDPAPILARLESAPAALNIDEFNNFDERHVLRVKQWSAWGTIADPVGLVPSWGYFDQRVWQRIHQELATRSRTIQADSTPRATLLALATTAPELSQPVVIADLVALPTGDSLIDTAASPGPRAIGRLWMMGDDDTRYVAWLEALLHALERSADSDPSGTVAAIRTAVTAVDAHTHGSRFYNIKQLRNAGMRILASRGHHTQAAQLLADQRPLHNQDWACPNRAGILESIEARLALASGELAAAAALLEKATASTRAFLADVAMAERDPAHGKKPPGFGPPPSKGNPPPRR